MDCTKTSYQIWIKLINYCSLKSAEDSKRVLGDRIGTHFMIQGLTLTMIIIWIIQFSYGKSLKTTGNTLLLTHKFPLPLLMFLVEIMSRNSLRTKNRDRSRFCIYIKRRRVALHCAQLIWTPPFICVKVFTCIIIKVNTINIKVIYKYIYFRAPTYRYPALESEY